MSDTARSRIAKGRAAAPSAPPQPKFTVDLPAGGTLTLDSAEEVEMWESSGEHYIRDYGLSKANDLMLLGALLSHALAMYRAQRRLSDPKLAASSQGVIAAAAKEIRELEKALGIDKKTREAGGQHNVADYIGQLKRAAHEKGIHITQRTKAYEHFAMELRWKLRLLRNGDAEDRAHHGITEANVLDWCEGELAKLEAKDKEWAKQTGRLWLGRV